MNDTISRQAAIETLKDLTANGTNKGMICGDDAVHRMEMLPPSQPEMGQWDVINLGAAGVFDCCSKCKRVVKHKTLFNFCPNCGADMRESKMDDSTV